MRKLLICAVVLATTVSAQADMPLVIPIKPTHLAVFTLVAGLFYTIVSVLPAGLSAWLFYDSKRQPEGSDKLARWARATGKTALTGGFLGGAIFGAVLFGPVWLSDLAGRYFLIPHLVGAVLVALLAGRAVNR